MIPLVLGFLPAFFAAALIAAFYTQFIPFFQQPLLATSPSWHFVYYGFWILAILLSALVVWSSPKVRRRAFPMAILCLFSLVLTASHPIDPIAKNFVTAIVIAGCLTIFVHASKRDILTWFMASVAVLIALICLFDISFPDGFTDSFGRAAGFGVNANVTAASLLLGALASYSAMTEGVRLPFFIVIGAALVATLSRSTMIVAVATLGWITVAAWLGDRGVWRRYMQQRSSTVVARRLLIVFIGWLGIAATVNDRFIFAAADAFLGLQKAVDIFIQADQQVWQRHEEKDPNHAGNRGSEQDLTFTAVAKELGKQNSAASRALLLKGSIVAFLSGPPFGIGLQAAHDLGPHNTFLLFAIAFGWLGVFIPLGFLFLAFMHARCAGDLAFGLGVAGLMLFSHDVLLIPALLVPFVVGIAMQGSTAEYLSENACDVAAMKVIACITFALLVLGCRCVAVGYTGPTKNAIEVSNIWRSSERAYAVPLYPPVFRGLLRTVDTKSDRIEGRLEVVEGGKRISRAPAETQHASLIGNGEFYQSNRNIVVFTATDGSDPRANGLSYSVEQSVAMHPLMYLVLIATLLWCLGIFILFGESRFRGKGENTCVAS